MDNIFSPRSSERYPPGASNEEIEAQDMADKDSQWLCDGCGMEGTYAEVVPHINDQIEESKKNNWETLPQCGGLMLKGGPAYNDWMDRGIHPMNTLFNKVDALTMEYPELFPPEQS